MVDYQALGERIRSARRQHGLTQEALAEQADISTSFLGHIERGTRVASIETLVAICNALTITPQELLADSLKPTLARDLSLNLTSDECRRLSDFLRVTGAALASRTEAGEE